MKLVTTARQLRSALNMLRPVIEKRVTYPILSCVLIENKHLVGTNLDMILRVDIAAIEGRGRVAIEYFALAALLKFIPANDEVTIETVGGEMAALSFGTSRYDLPCLDPDGFPDLKGWKGPAGKVVVAAELNRPIRDVLSCVSTEETRYYLNGVCFSRDHDDRPVLVATDGHRLAASPMKFDAPWLDGKIVPGQTVRIINRMPAAARIEAVAGSETILRFVWPGIVLVTKLIEGSYPDWKRVAPLPEPHFHAVRIASTALSAALKRLMALSDNRRARACSLVFNDEGAVLRLSSPDRGTGTERLSHAMARTGQVGQQVISFNARFVLDMLGIFQAGDEIAFTFKDSGSPADVSAPGVDIRAILMPMRGADDAAALAALNEAFPVMTAAAE